MPTTETKFDFITSIYVFPSFLFEELEPVIQKVHRMLKDKGQFILVLSNEKYLQATVYFKNNALNWENNSKKTFILNEIWTVCYDYTGVALSLVSKPC